MTSTQRIVLVDDSEPDNVFHEIMLRRAGFEGPLDVFERASDALAHLRTLPDDEKCLVLLDINMPGMDGWQFVAAAEPVLHERPTVILVMLTSSGAVDDRERAAALEAVRGYVIKPLDVTGASAILQGRWQAA